MPAPTEIGIEELVEWTQRLRLENSAESRRAHELREMSVDTRLASRLERLAGIRPTEGREALLDASLGAAVSLFGADFGNIQRVHRGQGLEIVAQHGFEDAFLNYFAYVRDTSTPCGVALRAGELLCVPDVAASELFQGTEALERLLAAQVRAVTCMPLVSGRGEVVGMLSVHYKSPRNQSAREQARMRVLAKAVGEGTALRHDLGQCLALSAHLAV